MCLKFSGVSKDAVKARAAGAWDRILLELSPAIASALDRPGLVHIDCPIHGGRKDFRVFRDVAETGGGVCTCGTWPDGFALIGAVNGWSFKETLSEVGRLVLGDKPTLSPVSRITRKRDTAREDAAIRQRLTALWRGSFSLTKKEAEPGRTYLVNRGLMLPAGLQGVRYHPAMAYYDEEGKLAGRFPGLLALVTAPDGQPVTIHRTFLSADGRKAPVASPKKLCAHAACRPLQGASIRLFPAAETLAVAEGIETALAVTQLSGIPCWATVSAGLMEQFVPPPGVRMVRIFADRDSPNKGHPQGHGQEAAEKLARRLTESGVAAKIELPPMPIPVGRKGVDWLDVLEGVNAIRAA